jgi:hypothetical protein
LVPKALWPILYGKCWCDNPYISKWVAMRKIVSGISEVAAMTEQYDRKEKNSCETGKYFVN